MTNETLQWAEQQNKVRACLVDFDARLHFEIEGPERLVKDAKTWFGELLEIAYKLRTEPGAAPAPLVSQPAYDAGKSRVVASSRTRKASKNRRVAAPSDSIHAPLELEPDKLDQLAKLVEKHSREHSGEDCILWIACLLKEKENVESFTIPQIEGVYRAIISAGAHIAVINDVGKTIQNMMSPSRKKMWVKSLGNGVYSLSSGGLLAVNKKRREANQAPA